MVVNFTSNQPIIQKTPQQGIAPANTRTPAMKQDTVSFGSSEAVLTENREEVKVFSNLVKGAFKPVKDIFKAFADAPLATATVLAATAAAIAVLPAFGTALALGITLLGAYKITKGTISAIKDANKGDIPKANEDIRLAGEGIFDAALTAYSAVKGVKAVSNSVSVAKEATAALPEGAEPLTFFQKATAILKQVDNKDMVAAGPRNLSEMITKIKDDASSYAANLKEKLTLSGENAAKDKISGVLANLETLKPEQLDKTAEVLDKVSVCFSGESQAKTLLQQASGWLKERNYESLLSNRASIIEALNDSNFESVMKDPQILKVINTLAKAGNLDDMARFARELVGLEKESSKVAEVAGDTLASTDASLTVPDNVAAAGDDKTRG